MKKVREFQKNFYFCFIDYFKVYDCMDHSKLWKILQEMGIPDHLSCLLRNLYAGQEAKVRTGHWTTARFKIGKGIWQDYISSLCLFNLHAEYIMYKASLDEAQLSSVTQSCLTLCDPMNRSMPGLPVHRQISEFTQTHVHRVRDAIQPSHPLSSPSPPALNPSQHQSFFQWVNSSHEGAKVLEFQL